MEVNFKKPFWWMGIIEIGLFAMTMWFLFNEQYLEAIITVILIKLSIADKKALEEKL
jgi:TM2 domain-containing membrane protein YozV